MALSQIKKWGNSLGIRIPKNTLDTLGIQENDEVVLEIENNKLVLTPIKKNKYALDELVKAITENNLHKEIDTGNQVGHEVW